jgi:hypothetical protein
MNVKKLLLATVAVGVAGNIIDFVFQGMIMASQYAAITAFRKDASVPMLVLGDFVAALVLVWVYDRVYGSFGGGPKGGATFGLYAGVLVNFPTWILLNLLIVGFPYWLAWTWTVYGVVATVIWGAVAGAVYKR